MTRHFGVLSHWYVGLFMAHILIIVALIGFTIAINWKLDSWRIPLPVEERRGPDLTDHSADTYDLLDAFEERFEDVIGIHAGVNAGSAINGRKSAAHAAGLGLPFGFFVSAMVLLISVPSVASICFGWNERRAKNARATLPQKTRTFAGIG